MSLLFDFDTNEGETSRLDDNESSSVGSNFNANRTRFCGRRLCNTAADNISDESDESAENDGFNGEAERVGLRVGNDSAPIISIKLIEKKNKKISFQTYEVTDFLKL